MFTRRAKIFHIPLCPKKEKQTFSEKRHIFSKCFSQHVKCSFHAPVEIFVKRLKIFIQNSAKMNQFRTIQLTHSFQKHHLEMWSGVLTIMLLRFTEKPTFFRSVSKFDLEESFLKESIYFLKLFVLTRSFDILSMKFPWMLSSWPLKFEKP